MFRPTVHTCVGFPLVVPSAEGLAIELGTLSGSEVDGVLRTGSSVTQFIRARRALAKPAAIHWPEREEKTGKKTDHETELG